MIAGHEVLAVDPNGNTRQLKVGFKQGRPAFTSGVHDLVAFYSLNEISLLNFEYIEPLTFNIRIFPNDGPEIQYPENENGPEVMNIDSDSESYSAEDHNIDFEPNIHWEKVVTDKFVRGRAPLVSSAEVLNLTSLYFHSPTCVAPAPFHDQFHLYCCRIYQPGW